MSLFQRIFGAEFLDSLSEILRDLEGMQAGFRKRNLEVMELIRDEATAFLLVNTPNEGRYLESKQFVETLKNFRIPLGGIVLNQIEAAPPAKRSPIADPKAGEAITAVLDYLEGRAQDQARWVREFQSTFPSVAQFQIPRRDEQIHDVLALSELTALLIK